MIAFACTHCGLKLKVKDEFAGRSSKCPTCKQPLVVPQPDQTQAHVPAGQIDGTVSSVHQAGVDGGVTLGSVGGPSTSGHKSVGELLSKGKASGQRYIIESEIARGGMGAVLRAIDCDIRREVAVKFMLDDKDPKKKARFVEEAQITGQLEHPNIVPIHELGVDAKKRLFFAMKMVKGRSLGQVLDELRKNPKVGEREYPLSRLLTIFVSVCHAMAYAHARSVVHRDLKPANIMIGDFGEVYVMDWGLAKVVGTQADARSTPAAQDVEAEKFTQFMKSESSGPVPTDSGVSASSSGTKVSTSGRDDADLTQEGSVLGTPVYMPPEQAMGELGAIDQRSDIYSLGAILYELLTLQAPIEKEGGFMAILLRVGEGDIKAPAARAPRRSIPREVSAIAMKALAKDKQNRYQTAEELRRDIERFQEGRSVSAKEDTKKEMLIKFVKRNKGFSAATTVGLVLLLCSFAVIVQAWLATGRAYAEYKKEHDEKEQQTREAVPALVKAARLGVVQRDYKNALDQVNLALRYAPEGADALLLKGQLLIVQQDFAGARVELETYLCQHRTDAPAKSLVELCQKPHPEDEATSLAFARVFNQQEQYGLIDGVLSRYGKTSVEARKQILEMYRTRIEMAWPARGKNLEMDANGLWLSLRGVAEVRDLSPLKNMPLTGLFLDVTPVHDLTPLKGMPLNWLIVRRCGVSDLTPLKGMPLTELYLFRCGVSDLAPLKGMKLRRLECSETPVRDLTPLEGMELEAIVLTPKNIAKGMEVLRAYPKTPAAR